MIRRFILKHLVDIWGGKTKYFDFFWDMYTYALDGMNYGWGDYSIKNTSETNIFKLLYDRSGDEIIIFDGGAHKGEYTLNLLNWFENTSKKISIHAFEPMSKSMEKYKEVIGNRPDVKIVYNRKGLVDKIGSALIFFDSDSSIMASLYQRQLDYFDISFNQKEKVDLTTVDEYCKSNFIDKIDLLKLVVEGSEFRALQGAQNMIGSGKIDMIQFGFGGTDIDSRFYFRDFWNYLTGANYSLFRVMKDGLIKFNKYDEKYECFQYVNFLAVYNRNS